MHPKSFYRPTWITKMILKSSVKLNLRSSCKGTMENLFLFCGQQSLQWLIRIFFKRPIKDAHLFQVDLLRVELCFTPLENLPRFQVILFVMPSNQGFRICDMIAYCNTFFCSHGTNIFHERGNLNMKSCFMNQVRILILSLQPFPSYNNTYGLFSPPSIGCHFWGLTSTVGPRWGPSIFCNHFVGVSQILGHDSFGAGALLYPQAIHNYPKSMVLKLKEKSNELHEWIE